MVLFGAWSWGRQSCNMRPRAWELFFFFTATGGAIRRSTEDARNLGGDGVKMFRHGPALSQGIISASLVVVATAPVQPVQAGPWRLSRSVVMLHESTNLSAYLTCQSTVDPDILHVRSASRVVCTASLADKTNPASKLTQPKIATRWRKHRSRVAASS